MLQFQDDNVLLAPGTSVTRLAEVLPESACPVPPWNPHAETAIVDWNGLIKRLAIWYHHCRLFAARNGGTSSVERLPAFLLFSHPLNASRPNLNLEDFLEIWTRLLAADKTFSNDVYIDGSLLYEDLNIYFKPQITEESDQTRIFASTIEMKLCKVPPGARSEDTVALIRGAPFPFILREREDGYWSIIGDAVVDEIMDGEVCPSNEEDWQYFAIK